MIEWLNIELVNFFDYRLTLGGLFGCIFSTIIVLSLLRLLIIALGRYSQRHHFDKKLIRFSKGMLFFAALLMWLFLYMVSLELNPIIYEAESKDFSLTYRNVLLALLLIVVARIADKLISSRLLEEIDSQTQRDIYKDQYGLKNQSNISKIIQYVLFILVSIVLIKNSAFDYSFPLGNDSAVIISISSILLFILVLLIARLLLWMAINLFLYGWYKREKIDLGKQYSYNQLLSYITYFFAFVLALQLMNIKLTLLLAGAAALLVGIGIALQQVISDFFSGLVILFERSVEVGDFLDFGNYRGTVKKIGLRASMIETLERKDVIIPNSHLVNDRVTNWSSTRLTTRFDVLVGVAYGSDTSLVKELLLEATKDVSGVLKKPLPFVRFLNFGDSSLDFALYFFSDRVREIEDVKSNLRFNIDRLFRQHDVIIPFPQRDLWVKNPSELRKEDI